jgi:transposase
MKYGVGIDVSKGKSTVSIMKVDGEIVEMPFEINHDINGFEMLEQKIKDISKEDLKIVMEETGTYHLPVLCYLLEKDYFVVAENALKIKLKNNFSDLCDLLFPGYYQLLDENNFVLGLKIFEKYYHPALIINKKQSTFVNEIDRLAKKLGHKGAGKTLANKIYKLAQNSISPRPNNEYSQLAVVNCVAELILIINSTDLIISKMSELASTLPEYDEVIKMPGVGKKLAPRIISEIGDIRRFNNAGCLIAYAGLDAPPYQSGQFEATIRHISKRGNKYLRKAGYEIMRAIKTSCKVEIELYDYIVKKENEGKAKKVAKIAGLNKFLRMYYGTVKRKYKELEVW